MSDLDTDIGGTAATPRPQVLSPVDERALAEERQRLMDAAQTSDDNAIPTAPVYQTAPELVDEATPLTPPGSLASQVVHPAQRAVQATNPAAGAEDPELTRSAAMEESGGYVPPGYKRSGAQATQVAPQGPRQAAITQELTGNAPLGGTPETQPSALEQIATENATVWGESQQFLQDNLYDPITKSDVRDRAIIAVGKVNEVRLFRDRMAAAGFSDDQILQMPELMTAANIARRAMEDELTPDQRRTYVNEILPSIGPALHGADATITAIGSMAAMGVLAPEGLTSGLGEAGALGKGALAVLSGPEGALSQIGLEAAARPVGAALGAAARSPAARAVFEEARAAFNAVSGKEPLNPAEVAPFLGDELAKNGGFIYSITHGNMAGKNAWAVGMYPEKSVTLDHIASPDEIEHYIADNFDHLGLSGNNVGGWFDDGKTYLDVSRTFTDRNQAIGAAKAAGQEAISHLGTGDEVHVLGAVPETAAAGVQRMGAGVPLFSEGVQQNVARPSAYDFVDKIKEAGATRVGDFEMKSETAPTSEGHYFLGPDGDLLRVPLGLSHDMTAAKALGLPYMDWAVTDNSALKQASDMGAVRVMSRPNVIAVQSGDPLNPMQTNKIYPFARSREITWDVAGETGNGNFYAFRDAMTAISDRSIVQHPSGFSALLKLGDRGMPRGAGTQRTMDYTEFFNRQRDAGETLSTDFLRTVPGAPSTSAAGYGRGTPTALEDIIKLARAGEGAKDWYPEAGEHFIKTMPKATDAAEKFSGVLSAQRSPAAAWGLQLRAQQAARELSMEGQFTEENFVKRFYELARNQPEGDIQASPGLKTQDVQHAADLAFRGATDYPTRLKIPTYSNAVGESLFGTGANPVIDHHVMSALGYTAPFGDVSAYEAATRYSQAMIEQAAKDLEWTPTQVQAALYHADKGLAARGLSVQDLHAPPEGALGAGEPGAGNAQGLHFDNLPSFPYDETVEGSIPHMVAVNKGRMAELQPLLDQMPEFPQPDVGPPRPAGGMTVTGGSNMRAFTLAPGHEYRWAGVATGAAGGASGGVQANALNDYVNPSEEGQDQAEASRQAAVRVGVTTLLGAALGAKAGGGLASGFPLKDFVKNADALRYVSLLLHVSTGVKIAAGSEVNALADLIKMVPEIGFAKLADLPQGTNPGVPESLMKFITRNAPEGAMHEEPRQWRELIGASQGFMSGQALAFKTAAELMRNPLKLPTEQAQAMIDELGLPKAKEGLAPVVQSLSNVMTNWMAATHLMGRIPADSMYAGARAIQLASEESSTAQLFGGYKRELLRDMTGKMVPNTFENRLENLRPDSLLTQGIHGVTEYAHARSRETIGMEHTGASDLLNTILRGNWGGTTGAADVGRQAFQGVARLAVPISHIPVNFLMQGLDMASLGLVHATADAIGGAGVQAVTQDAARGVLGASMLTAGAMLHDHGILTGATPTTPEERNKLPDGWLPYSFKVTTGDTTRYIPAPFLGKYGIPMSIGASINEMTQMPGGVNHKNMGTLYQEVAKSMLNHADLYGASQVMSAALTGQGWEKALESPIGQLPFMGFVNDIERLRGLSPRETSSVWDRLQSEIPGLADQLPPRLTPLGEEMAPTSGGLGVLNPVTARTEHDDPTLVEMRKLWPAGTGGPLPDVARSLPGGGMGTEPTHLSNEQIFQLALSRKPTADSLRTLINSDEYKDPDLSDDGRRAMIKSIVTEDMADAERRLGVDRNEPPVEGPHRYVNPDAKGPESAQELRKHEESHRTMDAWRATGFTGPEPPTWMYEDYMNSVENPDWKYEQELMRLGKTNVRQTPPAPIPVAPPPPTPRTINVERDENGRIARLVENRP